MLRMPDPEFLEFIDGVQYQAGIAAQAVDSHK
jgi:hypothetical protein